MTDQITATYTNRPDGMTVIESLNRPITDALKYFDWAGMIPSRGWLIPTDRLDYAKRILAGLEHAVVTLVPVQDPLSGPTTTRTGPLPLPECTDCTRPLQRGITYDKCPWCGATPCEPHQHIPT